ncbi:MAG: methyl-accepting chemotaxis protein [Candidatus Omnitrophica bacterium]|nr:methyl-accepting chemotaxis protein [Candidatus Omnitrophota bacterium]MBU4148865.1 methyl-accepting chemotaxis protein [Candidatus Omnitrophota bacterium]
MAKYKRRNYFINKTFQAEFMLKFCGLVAIGCTVFGTILYIFSSKTLTTSFENSRLVVKSTADYLLPGLLFGGVIVAVLIAIVTTIVVMLMTHRLVGPMYRFKKYAEQVGSGNLCSDLKIRQKDQFQNLVSTFNKMTDDLRIGLLKVMGVSDKLDDLIEQLLDKSNNEILLKEDIKKIVSELKKDKRDLKKALEYFKVNCG